jgi:branched-chain amino acid transport system substrate-binding protein
MNLRHLLASFAAAAALIAAYPASAQKPIRIGYPVILSGPGALIGEPSLKGAQMFVEEINAKGGVLNRKIELVVRDTKGNADEAVRVARDLILRENVDFLVGTLTSAEGPAVSPVAKENKIVFVVPVVKTDQLTAPANLHPYIFRTASTTTIEGRTAAEIMAKWPVKKVATMSPDYAFGQDVTKAFVTHIKKIRPDIEIIDQQWPKLGETDYTPFINAQMSKKPDAVFSSLWGGHFVTFVKQARPLKYYEAVNFNVLAAGEAGAIETAKAMGDDYPYGVTANAYDAFNWTSGPPAHRDYIARLQKYLKEEHPSSWPITGYIGMQVLTAAIQKANSTDSEKVAQAMLDLSVETPIGKQVIRGKDHQANRAQFWGKMTKDPKYPFAVMSPPVYIDPAPFMD